MAKETPRPTIGRIVLYQSIGTPCLTLGESWSPLRAAVVTTVHPDGAVDLAVLNPNGTYNVKKATEDPEAKKPFTWSWPKREG